MAQLCQHLGKIGRQHRRRIRQGRRRQKHDQRPAGLCNGTPRLPLRHPRRRHHRPVHPEAVRHPWPRHGRRQGLLAQMCIRDRYSILSPVSSYFTFWTFFLCRLSPAATARSSSPRPSGHAAAKQTAAIPAPPSATVASCKRTPPVSQSAKRCRRASPAPALTAPAKPGAPSHRQSCSRRPQLDSSRPVLAVQV